MFKSLRVIELASVLAGPSVGQFFAELGAQVIKVENPRTGGDVTRSWKSPGEPSDDRSAYFCSCNWGKLSVCLDLLLEENRRLLHRMVESTDIVLVSYKPGDAQKFGVDFATLSALNPRLIYGEVTGYGSDDDRVGYDAVIQAESGFMSMNGESNGEPLKMPVALVDVLAAHQLKQGLLLALMARSEDGGGRCVSVSLMDAALSALVNQATNWLVGGKVPGRKGSLHPNIAPYGETFETADGKRLLLAVGTDKQFISLCKVLGNPGLAFSPHFNTNLNRVTFRSDLALELAPLFRDKGADEWLKVFHQHNIPAGLVRDVREALSSADAKGVVMVSEGIRGIRHFSASGLASDFDLTAPPHLGEHTDMVLGWYRQ